MRSIRSNNNNSKNINPYKECDLCEDLGDCPHPDVEDNGLGTPMPPDVCPKPIDIMKNTINKRRIKRFTDNGEYEHDPFIA